MAMTTAVLDPVLVSGDPGRVSGDRQERPDPQVPGRARRRTFTAQYKLDVVAAYDAAPDGQKGVVLRREGLYSSHIVEWRRARDSGALAGLDRTRGRPAADPRDAQIARLNKEKAQLEQELAKARFVVDVQAKLHALLETISGGAGTGEAGAVTDQAITTLAPRLGARAACRAVGAAQASYYRRHRASPAPARPAAVPHRDRRQPRALSAAERRAILDVLHPDRFADLAPAETWAILLDEGTCLGSQSTFYRLLRAAGETRERRRQATHPAAVKPELLATGPDQVRSWDITKLHGPVKWTYYYLYVVLDICSRYATGWMLATRESAALAEKLIAGTRTKQDVRRGSSPSTPTPARR